MSTSGSVPPPPTPPPPTPPPAAPFPQPNDWADTPKVDKHENPWSATRDNSKSIVTLAGSILALTATFANTLVGAATGFGFFLLCSAWACLIGSLAAALFTQMRLASYLMGVPMRRNWIILSLNIAYFLLFAGLLLFGWSQYIRLGTPVGKPPESYFKKVGRVGPFPLSERTLCDDKIAEADCLLRFASRFDALKLDQLDRPPDLIVLIGSADRRALSGKLKSSYDSNAGLARARAEWVREGILLRYPKLALATNFMPLYGGPQSTTAGSNPSDLDNDRTVEVWAIAGQPAAPLLH